MRNRQGVRPGMKAHAEAELEESLDNASTSSREGPPEGNIALTAVSKANLLLLTSTDKGIFFWDNTIVAINVKVKDGWVPLLQQGRPSNGPVFCRDWAASTVEIDDKGDSLPHGRTTRQRGSPAPCG